MSPTTSFFLIFITAVFGRDNHPLTLPNCHELMSPGGTDSEVLNERDVDIIKGMIRDLIHSDETGCTDDRRKDFIASYVRLAWHDVATWDPESETGGAHARMRLPGNPEHPHNDADNAGFEEYMDYINYIHNFFGDRISQADLWVLAALTAIEFGGGPQIPWRWGRVDEWDEQVGFSGRLPHAWKGKEGTDEPELDDKWLMEHLIGIFDRLEYEDPLKALVVLSGAHNLGGPRPHQTGMVPGWLFEPIPWTPLGIYFHNAFYSEMLWQRWWDSEAESPDVHMTVHANNKTIMFYSDFALLWTEESLDLVHHYATNLGDWYHDFVDYFSRLLERGYKDEELHKISPAHIWDVGSWGMCSEFCGGGFRNRDVTCVAYPFMSPVHSEEMCLSSRYGGPKPADMEPCNNQICGEYVWGYTEYSQCDRTCGGGVQSRNVYCMNVGTSEQVDNDHCSHLSVPKTVEACNTDSCGYWRAIPGTEGVCDMSCENWEIVEDFPLYKHLWTGESPADFECVKEFYGNPRVMPNSYCDEYEQPETTKCVARFCEVALPHWRASQWSECDAECDSGIQTRELTCWGYPHDQALIKDAMQLPESACLNPPYYELKDLWRQYTPPGDIPAMPPQWSEKPATTRACNTRSCRHNMNLEVQVHYTQQDVVHSNVKSSDQLSDTQSNGDKSQTNPITTQSQNSKQSSNKESKTTNKKSGKSSSENKKSSSDSSEEHGTTTTTPLVLGLSGGVVLLLAGGYSLRKYWRNRERNKYDLVDNGSAREMSDATHLNSVDNAYQTNL